MKGAAGREMTLFWCCADIKKNISSVLEVKGLQGEQQKKHGRVMAERGPEKEGKMRRRYEKRERRVESALFC